MANFPAGPSNGQTTTINGIVYIYDATKTAWKRSTSYGGNLTVTGNITSANVVTGNVYTSGGIYWSNNGAAYSSGGGSGSSNFLYTASATAPTSPTKGDQWFDTGDGTLYEYIDDGDSLQWIDIQSPTFLSNAAVTSLSGDVSTNGNISASSIVITNGIYWSNGVPFVSSVYSNSNVTAYLAGTTVPTANVAGNVTINPATTNFYYTLTYGNVGNSQIFANTVTTGLRYNPVAGALIGATTGTFATSVQTTSIIAAAVGVNLFNTTAFTINMGGQAANILIGNTSGIATNTIFGGTGVTGGQAIGNIYAGNILASSFRFANGVNILSTISAGSTYSNTNVIAYLTQGANIGSGTTTSNLVAAATTTSTSTTTGALVVRGGAGVAGVVTVGGNIVAASTTATGGVDSGALVVKGGVGISGGMYVGSDVFLTTGFFQTLNAITSTSASTGAITTQNGGGIGVGGNLYVGNEFVVPGGGKITGSGLAYLLEKVSVSASAPSGNVNVDMATQSVLYWTGNATANVTANIRGTATQPLNSLLATGQSLTAVLFLPNGPSNFLVNTVKSDNATVGVAYQGNAAPVLGNSNSIDIYSFTILKTADATYKVFASQTQFMHPG